MRISKHFTLDEVTKSATAEKEGIHNILPVQFYFQVSAVAHQILEPIRAEYGAFSPTSWYRCPELNNHKEIRGSSNSQHMKGEAADVKINGVPTKVLADWISRNLEYDQLILERYNEDEPYSGWVHISYKTSKNRMEYKRLD
jgi:zinc D-Ala-D-Ala carboxypeptidase